MEYSYNVEPTALSGVGAGILIFACILIFAVCIISIVSMWKIFVKAGRPGWAAIVPVYNNWIMLEIGGQKGWFALLSFIPYVGGLILFVFTVLAYIEIAKRFGKSNGFAVGMILLGVVFLPMLAFSDAQYTEPATPTA